MDQCTIWAVHKKLLIISRNDFPIRSRNPKRSVSDSNNPIRSQDSSPNAGYFRRALTRVLANRMFMMRGSRLMTSFGFKVIFALKNNSIVFFIWLHYSMDKCDIWIADEMDMTSLQVRHSLGKCLLLQLLFIHDGAVDMRDLGVMFLWCGPTLTPW